MPSIIELLAHPERRLTAPPAPSTNLVAVLLGGMALWGLGLIVSTVCALTGTWSWTPAAVCGTGVLLGVVGLVWAHAQD